MRDVSVFVALGAGLLSFLSPCVLPLIPGYLSFVSGRGYADIKAGQGRGRVFYRTLFFVAGFTVVFVALGFLFSGGGMLTAGGASRTLSIVAGVVVTLFGLNMMFDFIKALNLEARFHVTDKPASAAGAFLVGMAFGAGWTPCIGPILASILILAARQGESLRAAGLLAVYSAGLALPFLLAGLFFDRLTPLMNWFKARGREVRIVSGLLLVALGLSMALGRLSALSALAVRAGLSLKSFATRGPAAATAWGAGIWAALAALLVVVPLLRKKKLLAPVRIVLFIVLVAMVALEVTGVVSTLGVLADWLLFQGA